MTRYITPMRVIAELTRRGLTQRQIAVLSDVSQADISRYAAGEVEPRASVYWRLYRLYNQIASPTEPEKEPVMAGDIKE